MLDDKLLSRILSCIKCCMEDLGEWPSRNISDFRSFKVVCDAIWEVESHLGAVFFEIFVVFKSLGGGKLECLEGNFPPPPLDRTLDEDTIVPGKHNRLLKQKQHSAHLHNTSDIVYTYQTRKSGFTWYGSVSWCVYWHCVQNTFTINCRSRVSLHISC